MNGRRVLRCVVHSRPYAPVELLRLEGCPIADRSPINGGDQPLPCSYRTSAVSIGQSETDLGERSPIGLPDGHSPAAQPCVCHSRQMLSSVAIVSLAFFAWSIVRLVRGRRSQAAGRTPDKKVVRDNKIVLALSALAVIATFLVGMVLLPRI